MTMPNPIVRSDDPETVLQTFRILGSYPIYSIGIVQNGITVHSQQSRALNLAWFLIKSARLDEDADARPKQKNCSYRRWLRGPYFFCRSNEESAIGRSH